MLSSYIKELRPSVKKAEILLYRVCASDSESTIFESSWIECGAETSKKIVSNFFLLAKKITKGHHRYDGCKHFFKEDPEKI
jgi:hypothetical protein